MSIDGTDCPIEEPTPFDAKWFSHKFNGAGLRYEIAISIYSGLVVWVNGGVPCGSWSDLRLARSSFVLQLDPNEKVLADSGYRDHRFFLNDDPMHWIIMARHETIHAKIKIFRVLTTPFRHDLEKHDLCFRAIVNIIQLMILNGETLFDI